MCYRLDGMVCDMLHGLGDMVNNMLYELSDSLCDMHGGPGGIPNDMRYDMRYGMRCRMTCRLARRSSLRRAGLAVAEIIDGLSSQSQKYTRAQPARHRAHDGQASSREAMWTMF